MSLPDGAGDAMRVGGGDINEAWRVTLADGRPAFVKSRPDASPGEYRREAAALEWLAEPGALRVPEVLDVGEGHLALAWIEQGRLSAAGAEELGRGLALTHAAGARCFGDPRLDDGGETGEATIGSLSLPNEPLADWPSFYAQRRLLPALAVARERGGIDVRGAQAVQGVCERIEKLAGPPEPPARLHGDLWSGNVLAGSDGRPWLIDPTAYGGHREVDLAMLLLFGAPSQRVLPAYEEASPLAEGWRERVGLWQLLPLLVHAALFGGGYGEQATRLALRYAS
ncbi:MAG TPA: fructosamine kinase family protein [Solirubrobacteraceae bacterium]|jgi:fructosamine-3-kinase